MLSVRSGSKTFKLLKWHFWVKIIESMETLFEKIFFENELKMHFQPLWSVPSIPVAVLDPPNLLGSYIKLL